MNKNEYETRRSKLNEKLSALGQEYVASNTRFKKGDRLLITIRSCRGWNGATIPESTRECFYEKLELRYGRLEYVCFKVKKDGTASKFNESISSSDIVTLIE